MKKILCTVVAFLIMMGSAYAGCVLPDGTQVYIFSSRGMVAVTVPGDKEVTVMDEQPTAENMKIFQETTSDDWSDSIAVHDEADNVFVMVHKGDLVGDCEVPKKD